MSHLRIVLSGLRLPKDLAGLKEIFAPEEPDFVIVTGADSEEIKQAVVNADCLVCGTTEITAEIIQAGKKLSLIQKAGLRHETIDLDAAKRAGVPVCVARKLGRIQIAEHAFALILALYRRILPAHEAVIQSDYEKRGIQPIVTDQTRFLPNWFDYRGMTTLFGQTLAILGMGEIGTEVALHGKAFGMNVIYHQRRRIDPRAEKELGAAYVGFEELLGRADVLVLCVPQTPETAKMIGSLQLSLMKPTALLVNIARGGLLDEEALAQALERGQIAGAGLDVFRQEPLPRGNPLLDAKNVVLTPHLAMGEAAGGNVGDEMKLVLANVVRLARGLELEG